MELGRLRGVMAEKGMRQYEVARGAGISESRFSRCLRGLEQFSPEEREKIARFLGLPVRLLFREVKPRRGGPGEGQAALPEGSEV